MIGFDEAIALIGTAAKPLGQESVAIDEAAGRVLAEPVIARIDSPRCDVSAMDGYAVRDGDLAKLPARLAIVGQSYAGAGWDGTVGPGECARIFTGAPVPGGADRVVIQENVERDGDFAVVADARGDARFIRARGSDFRTGDELLPTGTPLNPRALVAAAAADLAQLTVYRRPRVALLATGDELADPGCAAGRADAVPDSVSPGILALAEQWGAATTPAIRLRDDLGAMEAAAKDALAGADLVVVTGGASVGEKDFAKAMFAPHGLELIFAKLAIKPGKPAWFGRAGGSLVMGLPGNPTSAMVTARLLLAPLLAVLNGRRIEAALRWRRIPLLSPLASCGDRETFHRARWRDDGADVLAFQESHAQGTLAEADLLLRQRAHAPAAAIGELMEVLDF